MNFDDPRITAYALGELDSPADRAAVEALLRENPEAAAELEVTRSIAEFLTVELKTEEGAPLTKGQREHVLAVAAGAKTLNGAAVEAGPQESKVVTGPWYRRHWIPSAVAATVVLSTGIGLFWGTAEKNSVTRLSTGQPEASAATSVAADAQISVAIEEAAPMPMITVESGPATPRDADTNQLTIAIAPAPSTPLLAPAEKGEKDNQTQHLYNEALNFYRTGRYDLAFKRSEQVLNLDPSNIAARKMQEEINKRRDSYAIAGYNHTRSYMTWQVDKAWDRPVRKYFARTTVAAAPSEAEVLIPGKAGGSARPAARMEPSNTESYDSISDNVFRAVKENPLSTFSIDVDTASYANVRRFLTRNQRPPKGAVRIEELVNYFPYSYTPPAPESSEPFSTAMEVAPAPWAPEHRLVRIALKGREIAKDKLPPSNLVFLIDVSGSMNPANKLPLVKESLLQLVEVLREQDTVGIVVYAGSSGVILEPTSDKTAIRDALSRLNAGGSTNGASGIHAAYDLAQGAFKKDGNNRVVLATDGDFNVGVTSQSDLVDLIERKAKTGIFLSVLGFGAGNTKDSTMEKLADRGNGNYAYVDSLREGRKVLVEEMSGTLFTIAKDVKIQVEFNPAKVGAYRLIGYENRILAKEDFNDDTKDAGEIGAGHTVTALYEIVPAGSPIPANGTVDPLKYQPVPPSVTQAPAPLLQIPPNAPLQGDFSGRYYLLEKQAAPAPDAGQAPALKIVPGNSEELLTLKLRYKQPDGDTSILKEFPLTDAGTRLENSTPDFRWAAAVASFGMILRDSPHRGNATWDSVAALARDAKGEDVGGHRAEFLTLVDRARQTVPVTSQSSSAQKPAALSKADALRLAEFDLKDQPVLDAIDALSKRSKEVDEERVGVAIVYAGPSEGAAMRVTLQMRNISILEAARTIASAAGLKLDQVGATLILRAP